MIAAVRGLVVRFGRHPVVDDYTASQYWLTYRHGFVRRGLPGQLLGWLFGAPAHTHMTGTAVVLCFLALAAAGVVVAGVCRRVEGRSQRLLLLAVLLWSPFT